MIFRDIGGGTAVWLLSYRIHLIAWVGLLFRVGFVRLFVVVDPWIRQEEGAH
jgi:hypothetical protein